MIHIWKSIFIFPKQAVDKSFDGTLNVLLHNASQIYVPEGDNRHPYEIGQPRDSTYGNLLKSHDEGKDEQKSKWSFTGRGAKKQHFRKAICKKATNIKAI